MHKGSYSPYFIYNTKHYQLKLGSMQEARKAMEVKQKHLAINKPIQLKSQYEDEQKYSTTRVNISCPRTMSIKKYFPDE